MAAIERAPGLERPGALGYSVPRRMRYTPYTPPQRGTALSHPCPGKPGLRPYSRGRIISRRTAGALNKPRLRATAPTGGLVDIPPSGCGLTRRRFLPPLSSSLPLTIRRATSRFERKTVSRSTAPAGPLPGIIHRPPYIRNERGPSRTSDPLMPEREQTLGTRHIVPIPFRRLNFISQAASSPRPMAFLQGGET